MNPAENITNPNGLCRLSTAGTRASTPPDPTAWHEPADDADELDPADVDPACAAAAARVRAAFAQSSQDAPSASDDAQGQGSAETRSPCQRSVNCGHCGRALSGDNPRKRYCRASCRVMACRERKATPAQYPAEEGRR